MVVLDRVGLSADTSVSVYLPCRHDVTNQNLVVIVRKARQDKWPAFVGEERAEVPAAADAHAGTALSKNPHTKCANCSLFTTLWQIQPAIECYFVIDLYLVNVPLVHVCKCYLCRKIQAKCWC